MKKYYCLLGLAILCSCNAPKVVNDLNTSESEMTQVEIALLDKVQKQTFNYMWDGAEPISGAARERLHMDDIYPSTPKDVVTSGGTGFGIMALIVGIDRGFLTRKQGYERLDKLADWLEKADRFHGAWPHWMDPSGKTFPFSKFDDGGDLVETSFLAQGLIVARQYFKQGNDKEKALASKLDELWKGIDFDWYTNNEDVLFWHWSANYEWKMNFRVGGHNECLIMYVLGASSPTHAISADVYHKGYMRGGAVVSDQEYYGLPVVLDHYEHDDKSVGPMFWAHYSHLGLDPHDLKDKYADFWTLNQNHAKIQHRHCVENPYEYRGYSDECWGLTSSYSMMGYAGHSPEDDLGVISPTAALASFPYTPVESMKFLKFLYEKHPEIIGEYGPYDAFSFQSDWMLPRYLAIDQLPIPVMIENYRTGLIWDLFMSAPEVQAGLGKLDFTFKKRDQL